MSGPDTLEAAQRLLGTLAAGRASLLQLATSHLPFERAARLYTGASSDGQVMDLMHGALERRVGVAARRLVVVESAQPAPARAVVPPAHEELTTRPSDGSLRPSNRLQRALVRGDGGRPPAVREDVRVVEPPSEPFVELIGPAEPVDEPAPIEAEFTPAADGEATTNVAIEDAAAVGLAIGAVAAGAALVSDEPTAEAAMPPVEPSAPPAAEVEAAPIVETKPEPVPEPAVEPVVEPVAEVVPEPVAEVVLEPLPEVVPEPVAEVAPEAVAEVVPEVVPAPEPQPIVAPVAAVAEQPAADITPEPVDEVPALVPPVTDPDQPSLVAPRNDFADPPPRARTDRRGVLRSPVSPPVNDDRTDPRMVRSPEPTPIGRTAPPVAVAPSLAIPDDSDAAEVAVAPAAQLNLSAGRAVAAVRVAGAEDEVVSSEAADADDAADGTAGVGEAVGSGLRVGGKKPPKPAAPVSSAPRLTEDDEVPVTTPDLPHAPVRTAADDAKVEAMVKDATTLSDRGDFVKAIQTYTDVLDLRYDRLDAYIGRGRSHLELGDYSSAMSDFQRAEDLSPDRPEPHVAMGDLYFARKEYRRAIECYDQAVELDGSHAMARCRRGISHYYRKNYRQAYQDLQRALTLDPEIPNIRKYVQMASKKMERPD